MSYPGRSFRVVGLVAPLLGAALLCAAPEARAQLTAGAPADTFDLTNWVTGLTNPTDVAFLIDGRAVITQKLGTITVRRANGTLANTPFPGGVQQGNNEQGLLGVVALVNYRDTASGTDRDRTVFFYASTGSDNNNKHKVYRALVNADDTVTVNTTPIVSMGLMGPANHNGGGLNIYKDQIYISVGDTGANATPPQNKFSSCLNHANGKILRVNLDGSTPNDNPLVGVAQATGCVNNTDAFNTSAPDTRIYAWGLRNPFRFWVDRVTGLLWVGDVGETTREEVSIGDKGTHFGYPFEEGTTKYNQGFNPATCAAMSPTRPCTPPITDYPHQNNDNCVIGGPMANEDNRLCGWPDTFKSKYFFGDNGSGRIWTLDVNANRMGVASATRTNFGTVSGLSSLRMGFDDSLYAVSHGNGSVAKITVKATIRNPATCAQSAMNMGGAGGNPGAGGAAAGAGGNAGGRGGSAGGGGNMGNGGAGTGGASGSGTGGAVAGNSGNTGSGGGNQAGGSSAKGGSNGSGGSNQAGDSGSAGSAGGDGTGTSSSSAGCSCRFGGAQETGGSALLSLVIGAFLVRRRRRR